ncbi:MAG: mechanosensitive ion channel [bacterium]|nr:mechanosensitive ion channel [bacterium]
MEQFETFLSNFLKNYGNGIFWILILIIFDRVFLKIAVKRLVKLIIKFDFSKNGAKEKLEMKMKTLGGVAVNTGNMLILFAIVLILLRMFKVDTGPVLAGAGIIGLVIGFGTQSLIKDFVSGLFILIENQYNVGDRVKIGTFEGKVKKITIRSTILEDNEGRIIYLPNGIITTVINYSQGLPPGKTA